jgi:hypothetical protein
VKVSLTVILGRRASQTWGSCSSFEQIWSGPKLFSFSILTATGSVGKWQIGSNKKAKNCLYFTSGPSENLKGPNWQESKKKVKLGNISP